MINKKSNTRTQPDRTLQPPVRLIDRISLKRPLIESLDSGIPVYMINSPDQEMLKLEFGFRAGSRFEKKKLTAGFTNRMLKEGTESFSAREIADQLDYFGAILDTVSDKDMAYITLYTLNKHLPEVLPVLAEVIQKPLFPEAELNIMKQNRKQHLQINNEKVRYVAKRHFNALIYGDGHPYGKVFMEMDFDKIQRTDIDLFHEELYHPGNCDVIASGKVPGNLTTLLNRYFSEFSRGNKDKPKNTIPVPSAKEGVKKHSNKENALQTAIRIGKVMFNKTHPDYLKMKVVNTILGGYFGSRLMTNIREDKGFTYGIGSAITTLHQSGYFFITSEVGSEVTQQALKEIYFEIDRLRQDKVKNHELDLVRNYMLGSFLRSIDGVFSMADILKGLVEYGLDYDFYDRYIEIIKTITPGEIQELAQRYLSKESISQLTVGR